jgi:hypothetical protein
MIKRSTWVLLAVFAILLAVVLLLPKFKGTVAEPTSTTTPAIESPFTFAVGDVVEFRVENRVDGSTLIAKRGDDNAWKLVQPDEELSPSNNVEGVVAGIVNIDLLSKIDPPPPADLSGLDSPIYTVTLVNKSGAEEGLVIGNLTPTSSGYYVQTDDGQVYVADQSKIYQAIDLSVRPPLNITPTTTQSDQGSEAPVITPTLEPPLSITAEVTQTMTQTIETTPLISTLTTPTP